MALDSLIMAYGYPVIFLGSLFEGETVLILGAFLAHRGYLELPCVLLVSFAGTLAADQALFFVGRRKGRAFLEQKPRLKAKIDTVNGFLKKYHDLTVLSFRFVYGFRTVTPIVIGMSGFSPKRYLVLNFLGALLWVLGVGLAGYAFGGILETIISDLKRYEIWVALGIAAAGTAIWLCRRKRLRDK